MIHSLTFRMTGSLADSEDLAQETFIQAFRQLGGYVPQGKFSSWLCRIAVNRCLNWIKSRDRRHQVHSEWGDEQRLATQVAAPRIRLVQDALLKLPAKQRAAVVLTIYQGLNHAEAAATLGCSETTVSWRLFAARAKLKKSLAHAIQNEDSLEQE
jgi:RNA polymerase sigma-70 factor (ECF subfamily)